MVTLQSGTFSKDPATGAVVFKPSAQASSVSKPATPSVVVDAAKPQLELLPRPFVSSVQTLRESGLKSTDIMSREQSDRLQSVFQAIGAGTDQTVGFITSLGGLSPKTEIRPFAEQNTRLGLSEESELVKATKEEVYSKAAAVKTATQAYDFKAAEESLSQESTRLENIRSAFINKEGYWVGSQQSLDDFNKRIEIYNQNVATVTGRAGELKGLISEQERAMQKGIDTGVFKVSSGRIVENPENARPYGTFSDWGRGAEKVITKGLGVTPEQIEAYGVAKQSDFEKDPIGAVTYGAFKQVATRPEEVVASGISGVQLSALTSGLGYGVKGLAAVSQGTRAGKVVQIGTDIAESLPVKVAVPTGFGALGLYGASDGFTLTPGKTAVNVGSMGINLAAMGIGFGAGVSTGALPQPRAASEYISPVEKFNIKTSVAVRSLTMGSERGGAYREITNIGLSVREITPMVKAEPDIGILSRAGKYESAIKTTLEGEPHSIYGSASMIQQYPKSIAEKAAIRIGKDIDVFTESPTATKERLSRITGQPVSKVETFADIKSIPEGYPGLKASEVIEKSASEDKSSLMTKLFGDPFAKIAFPRSRSEVIFKGDVGYTGKLTYEGAQVQTGRKTAGAAVAIETPIEKGYRAQKDIYDFISSYEAQKEVALSRGVSSGTFTKSDLALQSLLKREIVFGTEKGQGRLSASPTQKLMIGDIYERMRKENIAGLRRYYKTGEITDIGKSEPSYSPKRYGSFSDISRSIVPSSVFGASVFGISPRMKSAMSPQSPKSYQLKSEISTFSFPSEQLKFSSGGYPKSVVPSGIYPSIVVSPPLPSYTPSPSSPRPPQPSPPSPSKPSSPPPPSPPSIRSPSPFSSILPSIWMKSPPSKTPPSSPPVYSSIYASGFPTIPSAQLPSGGSSSGGRRRGRYAFRETLSVRGLLGIGRELSSKRAQSAAASDYYKRGRIGRKITFEKVKPSSENVERLYTRSGGQRKITFRKVRSITTSSIW